MSCVIMFKHKGGGVDLVGLDQEYGTGPAEFVDRASAMQQVVAMDLIPDCDWFEIVPLPMRTPAKPASPTR